MGDNATDVLLLYVKKKKKQSLPTWKKMEFQTFIKKIKVQKGETVYLYGKSLLLTSSKRKFKAGQMQFGHSMNK